MAGKPPGKPFRPGNMPPTPLSPTNSGLPAKSKIAIPRLHPSAISASSKASAATIHRVSHACEPCRTRKTKCSGERPACKHCQAISTECFYADGKRDKFKREYDSMKRTIARYEQVLKDNSLDSAIKGSASERRSSKTSSTPTSLDFNDYESTNPDSDNESQGSLGSLDEVDEDFAHDHGENETGYMGKSSEVAWMRRLEQHTGEAAAQSEKDKTTWSPPTGNAQSDGGEGSRHHSGSKAVSNPMSTRDMSYHSNQSDNLHQSLPPDGEWVLPSDAIIRKAIDVYFEQAHPHFPVLSRLKFTHNVETSTPPNESNWYAQLNLVLAIASHYLRLIGEDLDPANATATFFARAQKILATDHVMMQNPDIEQVKAIGLASFYLMSVNEINRAWLQSGKALRLQVAMGFHLRSDPIGLSEQDQEMRNRVWWSMYTLDRLLTIMTGRPSMTTLGDFSTPLPRPVMEEDLDRFKEDLPRTEMAQVLRNPMEITDSGSNDGISRPRRRESHAGMTALEASTQGMQSLRTMDPNIALFFRCQVQLDLITQSILSGLYRIVDHSQVIVFNEKSPISSIETKLQHWFTALPPAFNFTKRQPRNSATRFGTRLGFAYYSAKIILYRPCLCDPHSRAFEKPKAKDIANSMAQKCVFAARDMLGLIHDTPNALELYSQGPWFAMVHYIIQAAMILLMEIDLKAHHCPDDAGSIFKDAKRALVLLHRLSATSEVACRGFDRIYSVLRKVATNVGGNIDDLPSTPAHMYNTYTPPSVSHMHHPDPMTVTTTHSDNWYQNQQMMDGQSFFGFESPLGMDMASMNVSMMNYTNDPRTWAEAMPGVMVTSGYNPGSSTQDGVGMSYGAASGGKYENSLGGMLAYA